MSELRTCLFDEDPAVAIVTAKSGDIFFPEREATRGQTWDGQSYSEVSVCRSHLADFERDKTMNVRFMEQTLSQPESDLKGDAPMSVMTLTDLLYKNVGSASEIEHVPSGDPSPGVLDLPPKDEMEDAGYVFSRNAVEELISRAAQNGYQIDREGVSPREEYVILDKRGQYPDVRDWLPDVHVVGVDKTSDLLAYSVLADNQVATAYYWYDATQGDGRYILHPYEVDIQGGEPSPDLHDKALAKVQAFGVMRLERKELERLQDEMPDTYLHVGYRTEWGTRSLTDTGDHEHVISLIQDTCETEIGAYNVNNTPYLVPVEKIQTSEITVFAKSPQDAVRKTKLGIGTRTGALAGQEERVIESGVKPISQQEVPKAFKIKM